MQALDIFASIDDAAGQATVLHNLARLCARKQDWEESTRFHLLSLHLHGLMDRPEVVADLQALRELRAWMGDEAFERTVRDQYEPTAAQIVLQHLGTRRPG